MTNVYSSTLYISCIIIDYHIFTFPFVHNHYIHVLLKNVLELLTFPTNISINILSLKNVLIRVVVFPFPWLVWTSSHWLGRVGLTTIEIVLPSMVVSITVSFKEKEIWWDITKVWVCIVQRTSHMFWVMEGKDEFAEPVVSLFFLQIINNSTYVV